MLRKNQAFLNRLNILLDMLLAVASYILASWLWLDVFGGDSNNMAALSGKTILLSCIYGVLLVLVLALMGFYNTTRTRKLSWKLGVILAATTISILLASALLFLFRLVDFSRGVLFLLYFFMNVLVMGKYIVMRLVFRRMREKGYNLKHVLVIGTGKLAMQYKEDVEKEKPLGFRIDGFIGNPINDKLYRGGFDQADQFLNSPDISEAVIALDPEEYREIERLIAVCEKNGVKYFIIPFYNNIIPAHPSIETVGRSKLINMRANRLETMGWAVLKRGFDLIVSFLGLVILSPLLLFIAIGVKLSSPGPILFRQTRVGYERKEFEMLKFRSMRQNAEETTAWTSNEDERRTKFGSLIRKTSLDELPQLWNVLRGEMSLVGPRPELPHFVEQFRETIPLYMVKHQVKPGMTGWAQVNGYRGDTSIEKRVELDLWYIEHWSVGLDIRILFRTIFGGMINRERLAGKSE